jgi:hypothetical protein
VRGTLILLTPVRTSGSTSRGYCTGVSFLVQVKQYQCIYSSWCVYLAPDPAVCITHARARDTGCEMQIAARERETDPLCRSTATTTAV